MFYATKNLLTVPTEEVFEIGKFLSVSGLSANWSVASTAEIDPNRHWAFLKDAKLVMIYLGVRLSNAVEYGGYIWRGMCGN